MSLERNKLGWRRIAGLGVGLVVAGQFAGWNYGLGQGSWTDMMAATVLMAILCLALSLCVAELAAALPNAGGLYKYSEAAFGRAAGYATGIAIFVALAVSTGAAAEFISSYSLSVTGFGGPLMKAVLFTAIIGIHVKGVGEALAALLLAGTVAVLSLVAFGAVMLPHFDTRNIIPAGAIIIDPRGVFACIPFAIMLFLAIEQTATSAEEARNPSRDVPMGMFAAVGLLLLTAITVLFLGPGVAGAENLGTASDPLVTAMKSIPGGQPLWLGPIIGAGALLGLVATLFSLVFSASRQLFALGRDHYLPGFVARQARSGTPLAALLAVGLIGFPLSFIAPDKVIVIMVTLLSASYIITLAAFIRLRQKAPQLPRPFRAPGGIATATIALTLAATLLVACLHSSTQSVGPLAVILLLAGGWFHLGPNHEACASLDSNA